MTTDWGWRRFALRPAAPSLLIPSKFSQQIVEQCLRKLFRVRFNDEGIRAVVSSVVKFEGQADFQCGLECGLLECAST